MSPRYQYLSFVDFLAKGTYMAPYGFNNGHKSLAIEREWGGWDNFFAGGSQMLAKACLTVFSLLSKTLKIVNEALL